MARLKCSALSIDGVCGCHARGPAYPARAVYDHFETGSAELSPDDLRARADDYLEDGDDFDALEAGAFAVLLEELKA